MKNLLYFTLFCCILFSNVITAEEKIYSDKIYKPSIKSVLLYPNGNEHLIPVIGLNNNDFLTLRFDDLQQDIADYYYRIIHCDPYWQASNLNEFYYIDGFQENPIYDYEFSVNTLIPYFHYSLKIPNKDVKLKLSGNYILQVYDSNNEEKIVFEKRFHVINKQVKIQGKVTNSSTLSLLNTHQDLEFSITYNSEKFYDPLSNMKIFITQNERMDKTLREIKPQYIRNNELIFSYKNDLEKTTFRAGYEFRFFNMTNLLLPSINVADVFRNEGVEHILLKPDRVRKFKDNLYKNDINGNFVIGVKNRTDKHLESDYVWVSFTLIYDKKLKNKVYVAGRFNDWQYNEYNRMTYSEKLEVYTSTILLKQGFYNYTYLTLNADNIPDNSLFDGSIYETENSYSIFVYHYDLEDDYYEFIGWKTLNSAFH